jgi:hypothetical protein
MAKPLQDLAAGKGHALPSPIVTPVATAGQAVAQDPGNVLSVPELDLPVDTTGAATQGSLRWVRGSDGASVAHDYVAQRPGINSFLKRYCVDPEANQSEVHLLAIHPTTQDSAWVYCVMDPVGGVHYASAVAFAGAGPGFSGRIIDSQGGSDFAYTLARYLARATVTANTDTSLLSGGYTVPGNLISANSGGCLHVVMGGDYLNNTGATKTLTFKIVYGATTLWADTSPTFAAAATRHTWNLEFWLANENATNAQAMWGRFGMSGPGAPAAGLGKITATPDVPVLTIGGTAAEDSTADKTLDVTVAHSVAGGATLDIRRYGGAAIRRLG